MESLKIRITVICLALSPLLVIAGGGWTQSKGKGYYQLSEFWTISDAHYTSTGGIDPNVTNAIYNTNLYIEYGITDRFNAIVFVPIFSRALYNNLISQTTNETIVPGEAINGIGDANVAIKYGLINKGPIVFASTLQLGLPIGESSGGSLGILQTGDGEFNQLLRFDASTSKKVFSKNSWYSLYTGVNNRTNGFSDEFHYGFETGIEITPNIGITAKLDGLKSFKNGSSSDANPTSIFANNSEFLIVRPGFYYKLNDKLGLLAEWSKPLAGRLIFSDAAYTAGVFLKL
jgi:hypothetical protein